jgi:hypothetical protein
MPQVPIYRTLTPDAPKVRVDGHVRATEDAILTLTVLAPEEVGLTTKEQPSLYWFQSKSTNTHVTLTIIRKKEAQPVLNAEIEVLSDGIQRVRLTDCHIHLDAGVEYKWSVAVVMDPKDRSNDVIASGVIKHVKPSAQLVGKLVGAPASELPTIYAAEGIWYDSLEALSNLVDAHPRDAKLRLIRAIYFAQVKLHDAAAHEMGLAGQPAVTVGP